MGGCFYGTTIGVMKRDTRSSDSGSYAPKNWVRTWDFRVLVSATEP